MDYKMNSKDQLFVNNIATVLRMNRGRVDRYHLIKILNEVSSQLVDHTNYEVKQRFTLVNTKLVKTWLGFTYPVFYVLDHKTGLVTIKRAERLAK